MGELVPAGWLTIVGLSAPAAAPPAPAHRCLRVSSSPRSRLTCPSCQPARAVPLGRAPLRRGSEGRSWAVLLRGRDR